MNRRDLVRAAAIAVATPSIGMTGDLNRRPATKRRLLAFGSGNFSAFLKHIIPFTGKSVPKICLVPTAVGDCLINITNWYSACEGLSLQPYVLRSFINSYTTSKSFEDQLMQMDAVFIGGGNTLNMLAVWKAQGIDIALRKAYERGVLMTGGSAPAHCAGLKAGRAIRALSRCQKSKEWRGSRGPTARTLMHWKLADLYITR